MSSGLRFSSTPSGDCIAPTIHRPTVSAPPTQKQKMSLTQTYYLAHTARGKLSKEAARGDHDLRLLVGHANLLDGLMLDLANAEQEQESWFNNTVNTAAKSSTEPKRVQWADEHIIAEEADDSEEEELYDESEDSDDDDESETEALALPPLARKQKTSTATTSPQPMTIQLDDDDDDDVMEDDDYEEELALTRSPTHVSSPPELMHEDSSESESDDDVSLPPSPPQTELTLSLDAFSEKQRQAIATTSYYHQSISPSTSSSSTQGEVSFFDQQPIAIAAY